MNENRAAPRHRLVGRGTPGGVRQVGGGGTPVITGACPARSAAGNVSLWVVIMVPVLLVFGGGLVLDGGRQLTARAESHGVAMAAARAGAQRTGEEVYAKTLNTALAAARANAELVAQGHHGTVTVTGTTITVTVVTAVRYLLLPGGTTETATVSVSPFTGVQTGVGGG